MDCDFEHRDGWCICKVCGYATKSADCSTVFSNCTGKKLSERTNVVKAQIIAPKPKIPVATATDEKVDTVKAPIVEKMPSVAQQAVHYAEAVTQHVAAGMTKRTDEEVDELLQICKACEHFNAEKGRCMVCGCKCNAGKIAWTNKLRMASQHCPKGKW